MKNLLSVDGLDQSIVHCENANRVDIRRICRMEDPPAFNHREARSILDSVPDLCRSNERVSRRGDKIAMQNEIVKTWTYQGRVTGRESGLES